MMSLNLNATVETESCQTRYDTPSQGQRLNIGSPLQRPIKQGKPTLTLDKISVHETVDEIFQQAAATTVENCCLGS